MVDVDAGRADAPADDFDGFRCGGRLGLLLGSTFLAVERRKIYLPRIAFVMIEISRLAQQLRGGSSI